MTLSQLRANELIKANELGACCRHNNGHVSRSAVRRVLARLGVLPTAAQLRALEARYLDDCGFSYVRLLDEVRQGPTTWGRAEWSTIRVGIASNNPHIHNFPIFGKLW